MKLKEKNIDTLRKNKDCADVRIWSSVWSRDRQHIRYRRAGHKAATSLAQKLHCVFQRDDLGQWVGLLDIRHQPYRTGQSTGC